MAKSRGLLISYAGYPYTPSSLMPDNGLANLAGSLISDNHEIKIMDFGTVSTMRRMVPENICGHLGRIYDKFADPTSDKTALLEDIKKTDKELAMHQSRELVRISNEISDEVERQKFDWVGFKLYVGDGYAGSKTIAEQIRKRTPNVKVYGGGPAVDILWETISKDTKVFDLLAFAEGEETIIDLANYALGNTKANFPNIVNPNADLGKNGKTKVKRIENLDMLPAPVYDEEIYPSFFGNEKVKIIVVDESRGCPNYCSFCAQPLKSGYQRMRSAEKVFEDIKRVVNEYNTVAFRYAGSSTPIQLMKEVAEKILDSRLKVAYSSFGHVRQITSETSETLASLKDSGLKVLLFGIETGSQKNLDKLNKGNTLDGIIGAMEKTKAADIFRICSFIYPVPGETEKTTEETFGLIKRIQPDSIFINFGAIFPGTPWGLSPEKFGFEVDMQQYKKFFLNYRIKTLFPPSLWEPLPYKLDGLEFTDIAKKTESFVNRLEEEGFVTRITDEMVIFAETVGINIHEFKRLCSKIMFSGDWEKMQELNASFNNSMSSMSRGLK
ncbi:MAG: radical SAM protein [Nanoarchaeota archaeon]|nr:radical SAM protein [Nanoarchaeota archaeon]